MEQTKPIFRPRALRHYNERKTKAVLPMFKAPRLLKPLLLLSALFLLAALLGSLTPIPTYSTGDAFRVGRGAAGSEQNLYAVLLPADVRGQLRAGQRVFLSPEGTGAVMTCSVAEVLPGAPDPEPFLRRYGVSAGAAPLPSTATVVLVKSDQPGLPEGADESSSHPLKAHVVVGRKNMLDSLFSAGGSSFHRTQPGRGPYPSLLIFREKLLSSAVRR